jgi:glycosyltransferase involved in cell wall biosynthesis
MNLSKPPDSNAYRVSIIIPTYNHGRYLAEAIHSVIAQTYHDFEIIVVDDGSTDETPQVIGSFGESVRAIRQDNKGLSGARNTGILAARGEFVGLLDADDRWTPNLLARMLPVLESDKTVGAVYCGWRYIGERGQLLPRININTVRPDQTLAKMSFSNFLVPSGVVIRRSCFDRLGLFDTGVGACEDWDMWLRILSQYRMVGVPNALVEYRVHGENMSSDLERMENARRAIIVKHFGAEEGDPTAWPEVRRRAYGGLYILSASTFFQRGAKEQGLRYVRRAFAAFPALTHDLDTFYMLACADQPTSAQGVFEYLDLNTSTKNIVDVLSAVFDDESVSYELEGLRGEAYGYAYLALGLLAYGARYMAKARQFFWMAIRSCPHLVFHPEVVSKIAKSFLSQGIVDRVKRRRNESKATG